MKNTVCRGYSIRSLREGPLVIQASEGAWPLSVRDDRGQLTIYMLEDTSSKPAEMTFTLVCTGVSVQGKLNGGDHVGSGLVSGHVWHVFEGPPQ